MISKKSGWLPGYLRLRIPVWCRNFGVTVNGEKVDIHSQRGFAVIEGVDFGDTVKVSFDTPIVKYQAHPFAKKDRKMVMVKRGPTLYCAESIDNAFALTDNKALDITLDAVSPLIEGENGTILGKDIRGNTVTLVPYRTWNNREKGGSMRVWIGQEGLGSDTFDTDKFGDKLYIPYSEY